MATPCRLVRMPCLLTAPWISTWIRRLDRSRSCSFCTTGSTNTDAPITTFWPDRSVELRPSAERVVRPLRPVTMNASFDFATLIRDSTNITSRKTSRTAPPIANNKSISRPPTTSLDDSGHTRSLDHHGAGVARHLDHQNRCSGADRLVRPGVELELVTAQPDALLAVSGDRDRRDDDTERTDQVGPARGVVGGHLPGRPRQPGHQERGRHRRGQAH